MNIEPTEVLDYIEASNNVIDIQKAEIDKMVKESSEKDSLISKKDSKIQELERKLSEKEKVAQEKIAEQEATSTPSWGTGEKQEASLTKLRESERALYERFGVSIN